MDLRPSDIFRYLDGTPDTTPATSVADSVDLEAHDVLDEALKQVRKKEREGYFINKAIQAKKRKAKSRK